MTEARVQVRYTGIGGRSIDWAGEHWYVDEAEQVITVPAEVAKALLAGNVFSLAGPEEPAVEPAPAEPAPAKPRSRSSK